MDARVDQETEATDEQLWRPERCDRIGLVLQGGGALGAYQAGVYEALHEAGIEPNWVSGVSIGAINSAIIAGNKREHRLDKLRAFWHQMTDRKIWHYTPEGDIFRKARNAFSAWTTMTQGQPGFFTPRQTSPWLAFAGAKDATSYYDTSPLRQTLLDLVDFDIINDRRLRFSVGAVNVRSGNFKYFDNCEEIIGPEHVMASGALPPAFPMVQIGTDYFWDGGLVSNTPLQHLLDQEDNRNALVFQVDLFNSRGPLPRDIQEVMSRQKDITYSSRTRYTTDVFKSLYGWKLATYNALLRLPASELTEADRQTMHQLSHLPEVAILHLIYHQKSYEGEAKDYEFSGTSMREHWDAGRADTARTLKRREWLQIPPEGAGIIVHDVHREDDR
jgi:NTE family protein